MNLDIFCISSDSSVRSAMERIEANGHGFVIAVNPDRSVAGLATDGDIRRWLLAGGSHSDAISLCWKSDFVFADQGAAREVLLKRLDSQIQFIPILDEARRLVDIVTRDSLPALAERQIYARARAPARISFGGGGSDLTAYFAQSKGAVINTTISLYTHATMRRRDDRRILVNSLDLDDTLDVESIAHLSEADPKFGLIQAVINMVKPDFGFELFIHSDFPAKSGLGGSAVVAAAMLGCFNQFRADQWDLHELSELAFQAERLHLGISGGWQDQYATVFGGFNFMEFEMDQNIVHPLRIHPDIVRELEECLVLCDTGKSHESGEIHDDQRRRLQAGETLGTLGDVVSLTYAIRNHLLRGRLREFGECLHTGWLLKRQFSDRISNPAIDATYERALQHGAVGGKLLGAGGGGFFLFFVPPFAQHDLIAHLRSEGLVVRPFKFDNDGLMSWSVREDKRDV
ncbi:CBS domain-containing protein [Devosia sp.]|uniref:GHMP family kinase ATP-binding protein n=1 Tax=Devosia sp. TaxID=1871048 RepID=UPI00326755BE